MCRQHLCAVMGLSACPVTGLQDIYLCFLDMASRFYQEVMNELQKRLKFTLAELLDPTRTHSSQVQHCMGYCAVSHTLCMTVSLVIACPEHRSKHSSK